MAYVRGIDLPSRRIAFRIGLDGEQARESRDWFHRNGQGRERCAVAINTYYPEVAGGYYENRSVVGMVQDALAALGYIVVLPDPFRRDGLVPVEERGCLFVGEEYYVADLQQREAGRLLVWQYSVVQNTSFYSDKTVLDFALSSEVMVKFEQELRRLCALRNVPFDRSGTEIGT